jgi:hypothetical protein
MSDELKDRVEPDRSRINVSEPHEVKYWIKELRVDAVTLGHAVRAVGPSAEAVRKYLRTGER